MTTPALVTGASSGFGRQIARVLASDGHPVVAVARRVDRLNELREEFGADRLLPLALDVRDSEAVTKALSTLAPPFADVRILVNCAGLSKGFGALSEATVDQWRQMIDTNIMGVLHCTQALLPGMLAARHGHIVNLGSIAGSYPYMGGNVYGASKAFVHQLSLNLRTDLQGMGVRVTCIEPGMAHTEFALVRFEGDRGRADALYEGLKPLTADDVAEAVRWCLAQPRHVNVNLIELMPTDQPFGLGFRLPHPKNS